MKVGDLKEFNLKVKLQQVSKLRNPTLDQLSARDRFNGAPD